VKASRLQNSTFSTRSSSCSTENVVIGYAFKWGDIVFDYRYLYYSQSDDKLIDNISFGGFALGANFRF
jgi:hypothetical protein